MIPGSRMLKMNVVSCSRSEVSNLLLNSANEASFWPSSSGYSLSGRDWISCCGFVEVIRFPPGVAADCSCFGCEAFTNELVRGAQAPKKQSTTTLIIKFKVTFEFILLLTGNQWRPQMSREGDCREQREDDDRSYRIC